MQPYSRRVSVSDGLVLHLLEWSREGVPMLLVHGFGNEAHIWDDFAPSVAGHYRVLALDLRGHGDSDWDPEGRYDYSNHLDDLESVVESLGLERLVLIGHSLGGRVSMRFAGSHPEKMAGLVIVDSAPELDARGTLRIRSDVVANQDPSFSSVSEYENYLAHAYPAATPEAIHRMALHGLRKGDDGRYQLKMDTAFRNWRNDDPARAAQMAERELANTAELWEALGRILCPTLVVRGAASDVMPAEAADRMVDEVLANGRLAVVPRAGHSVMTDNPDGFREVVSAFVLG